MPYSASLSRLEQPGISFAIRRASSLRSLRRLISRPRRNREETRMYTSTNRDLLRSVAAAAFVAAAGFTFTAQAGECPADKRMPNARQPVAFKAAAVTATTLRSIDLRKEHARIA